MLTLCLVLLFAAVQCDPDLFRRRMAIFTRWLQYADLTMEKAALTLGVDKAQLHRQVNGDGHLSFTRILLCSSPEQLQKLGLAIAVECGVPAEATTGAALDRVARRRRMASMALPSVSAKETA